MLNEQGFIYHTYKGKLKLEGYINRSEKEVFIPSHINGSKIYSLGKKLFQGSSVTCLSLPDSISYVNPSLFYGCYSLREITIREVEGSPRFYRTLKTALGHKTIKIKGEKNTFSYLLTPQAKQHFTLMWLTDKDTPFSPECLSDYFKKRGIFALDMAASEDNIPALIRAEELNKITASNIDRLINSAKAANASEALAHLIGYKEQHFGFSDIFARLNNELSKNPFAPSEIKKTFSIKSADTHCIITGYSGDATDIFIPQQMGDKPITAIGEQAFSPAKKRGARSIYNKLTDIELNCVSEIGKSAFSNCSSLASVKANAVKNIPENCFFRCEKLASFDFSSITSISPHAFQECSSLEHAVFSSKLKHLGAWAFFGCTSLKELALSSGVSELPELGFGRCYSLEELSLPKGVTKIGKRSFYECTSLRDIEFSSDVVMLDWESFSGCKRIQRLHIPSTIKTIGNSAFYYCTSLTDLVLDNGINAIEWGAFNNCQALEVVHLPDSVKKIDSYVFNECYALKEVHISPLITDMAPNVFNSCRFVRIYGKKDSYAQEYAWIYGIPFIEDKKMI